jgi:hypothetical protein
VAEPTALLWLDDELRKHLSRALSAHLAWCRRNAVARRAALRQLFDSLTDADGLAAEVRMGSGASCALSMPAGRS